MSAEVLAHTPAIQKYASEFGIPEYVPAIQAIMMQESGGQGRQIPCRASECPYNTQYPNTPGAIQDADYSIRWGYNIMQEFRPGSRMPKPTGYGQAETQLAGL